MDVTIRPFTAKGHVDVPTSKSVVHRYLIMAFLSDYDERIEDVTFSNDIHATIGCLRSLGANIEICGNTISFKKPNRVVLSPVLDCNESGSTLRFLIPLATSMYDKVEFTGKKSLFSRPLGVYEEIFKEQGIKYEKKEDGLVTYGRMKDGNFDVVGNISSQFISGLMFLNALSSETRTINVLEQFESREYVEITADCMREFGCDASVDGNKITTSRLQDFKRKTHVPERDFSQAAFFLSLGSINGSVTVKRMNPESLQGDKRIIEYLRSMGADIYFEDNSVTARKSALHPITIDLKNCIDLGPILFAIASTIEGETHITNIRRLRIKESDRALCMKEELEKCGISIKMEENDCYITGKRNIKGNFVFDSHNDHRIVMSLAVLSSIIDGNCTIRGSEAINKSYSDFFKDLEAVGGNINVD